MRKIFLAIAVVFIMAGSLMAQTGDWIRVDSALQTNPYYTYVPMVSGGRTWSGQIELTVFQNGKEFKTWGYGSESNAYNNYGLNYNCQISELAGEDLIKAQWIHYYHSTRDMTDVVNGRELQAKFTGWVDGRDWIPFSSFGAPPILYNNISDLYAVATVPTLLNQVGGDFIFRKVSPVIEVVINVIPKKMNIKAGKVPVVIFASETFDAGSIDTPSLTFGAIGKEQSLSHCDYGQDVDLDGRPDLVCHFNKDLTGFISGFGETTAYLEGKMLDGTLIEGNDSVWVIK